MSCSTIHLFLGILCIFNIILYKSINLESTSVIEKFDIVLLQSQINSLKAQIVSLQLDITEQQKILKMAEDTYNASPIQKNKDEYEFQKEQDIVNQRLLSDMQNNLKNLEAQLGTESQLQSPNNLFDKNLIKNQDNINFIINEMNKALDEGKKTLDDLKKTLNDAQTKYNLFKTVANKNDLDAAIAAININEYNFNSMNSYKYKFQLLLNVDKTDENINKILAPTHYPIARRDPDFKNNESVYKQQLIILEAVIKQYRESNSTIDELENFLKELLHSTDANNQEQINYVNKSLNEMKCLKEIMKIFDETVLKCLEYTRQIITLSGSSLPTTSTSSTPRPSSTENPSAYNNRSYDTPSSIQTPSSTQRPNSYNGQSYYDVTFEVDDRLNPIYPPSSTQIPIPNNNTSVLNYRPCTDEKVFVDRMDLYYSDITEKDPAKCKSKLEIELKKLNVNVTPSSSISPLSLQKLNYSTTKNGSAIINCMIMITVFSIGMLISTLLLPYLTDNQFILSSIISVINLAIVITIVMLTYYLFDNNVKVEKINNYKFNGMTIMGYATVIMGLIIFFVCGIPNMHSLFYPEQTTQPIQPIQTI